MNSLLLLLAFFTALSCLATVSTAATQPLLARQICHLPSDVSYCMDVMRVGVRFDDETAPHFVRLQNNFKQRSIQLCPSASTIWQSTGPKIGTKACVSILSRFLGQPEVKFDNSNVVLEHEVHQNRRCRSQCKSACKSLCRRVLRFYPPYKRLCQSKCDGILWFQFNRKDMNRSRQDVRAVARALHMF